MSARIVLPGSLDARLRAWLSNHPQGHERAALVLFRKLDRAVEGLAPSPRFVAVDAIELKDDWVIDSSQTHVRINMRLLPPIYLRCEVEGLELGFVHSHPDGALGFSSRDDHNEQNILRGYGGCNGIGVTLVALILCSGIWLGRTRTATAPTQSVPARHVTVLNDGISIFLPQAAEANADRVMLARQEAAFGKPFNLKLQSLRAVVVGCGGTGSPLATLLARSGIGELILIDGDRVEDTNLNRTRGYRMGDVNAMKASTLAAFISELGLGCRVTSINEFLDRSPQAVDAISGADIVFGCTDDVGGRDILTQAQFYYCLPLLDVGLTGLIGIDAAGAPFLRDHRGRISTVMPEIGACLRCQAVVTPEKLAYERAVRKNPDLKALDRETLAREYYLTGGGEAAPGVGPFTSMAADFALATFMNLIRRYREPPEDLLADNVWIDFVHLNIYSNERPKRSDCFCCGTEGLLNRAEGDYRLDMPSLGKHR